ncbi:thioredoxin-disulfide reductase [Salibacterium salarium]|uniref:Thioredoxin reductase n=1 Tax=Salibacterium salarium TaxID=284579 RepID=A0A428MVI7_9BACI|nr:thioredoxin-disulfide reductase [Salibacterium salarium]
MTAAVYTSRAKMKTLLIEKSVAGGQVAKTEEIENYPGFKSILGPDLSNEMFEHSKIFGAKYVNEDVIGIEESYPFKSVLTNHGNHQTKSVIIASGAEHRPLGVPGEKELSGAGVSYCAVCDGAFFTDQEIVVVGGGDSAVEEAIFLTRFASKVTIIHRRDQLRAQKILQKRAQDNEKINFIWNHIVTEVCGKGMVEGVKIKNVLNNETDFYPSQGVFIYIGMDPFTEPFKNLDVTNESGYVIADENMKTTVPGIFSAGDVNEKMLRQVITATGDGSIAAISSQQYVENLDEEVKEKKEVLARD